MPPPPHGAIHTATIHTPGSGYGAGETAQVLGGHGGQIKILLAAGGIPSLIAITSSGFGYLDTINAPTKAAIGSGLTLDIATVLPIGWGIPPGSGAISQRTKFGKLIRMRTIQHSKTGGTPWPGAALTAAPPNEMARQSRLYLAKCAQWWDQVLTAPQRLAWDAVRDVYPSGFTAYMAVQKWTQPQAFVYPRIRDWSGTPPFPIATGFADAIPGSGTFYTHPHGYVPVERELEGSFSAGAAWDYISFRIRNPFTNPNALPGQKWIHTDRGHVQPIGVFEPLWANAVGIFGHITDTTLLRITYRYYNSSTGIVSRNLIDSGVGAPNIPPPP